MTTLVPNGAIGLNGATVPWLAEAEEETGTGSVSFQMEKRGRTRNAQGSQIRGKTATRRDVQVVYFNKYTKLQILCYSYNIAI